MSYTPLFGEPLKHYFMYYIELNKATCLRLRNSAHPGVFAIAINGTRCLAGIFLVSRLFSRQQCCIMTLPFLLVLLPCLLLRRPRHTERRSTRPFTHDHARDRGEKDVGALMMMFN